jgi:hypothetical protein
MAQPPSNRSQAGEAGGAGSNAGYAIFPFIENVLEPGTRRFQRRAGLMIRAKL